MKRISDGLVASFVSIEGPFRLLCLRGALRRDRLIEHNQGSVKVRMTIGRPAVINDLHREAFSLTLFDTMLYLDSRSWEKQLVFNGGHLSNMASNVIIMYA